jgi:hypothetical protein
MNHSSEASSAISSIVAGVSSIVASAEDVQPTAVSGYLSPTVSVLPANVDSSDCAYATTVTVTPPPVTVTVTASARRHYAAHRRHGRHN